MRLVGKPHDQLTPPERRNVMAVLPYFHVYGNIVVMNWAMFNWRHPDPGSPLQY